MTLKIIHVVRDLDVASGGPSRSVPALAESQARVDGTQVTVLYQDRGRPVVATTDAWAEYRPCRSGSPFSGQSISRALHAEIGADATAVLHLHGLWSPALHRSARFARAHAVPYVVSTRGMLSGWAFGHKAWKKRPAWHLYQRRDLEAADCLVASSPLEAHDVGAHVPGARIEVIPNGCEPLPAEASSSHGLPDGLPGDPDVRWALALGRLHPVKGYAELIQAWATVRPERWKLAIAGPDEAGYRARLEELIGRHHLQRQVLLTGEVDDHRKAALLNRCELFLAPSRTENFGMAIAEALQSGTPVVTTTGTPWRALVERDCGWWVDPGQADLEHALREVTQAEPETLRARGARGQQLIQQEYSWGAIAQRSIELYRSLLPAPAAIPNP